VIKSNFYISIQSKIKCHILRTALYSPFKLCHTILNDQSFQLRYLSTKTSLYALNLPLPTSNQNHLVYQLRSMYSKTAISCTFQCQKRFDSRANLIKAKQKHEQQTLPYHQIFIST
jgi:hypothetical protein